MFALNLSSGDLRDRIAVGLVNNFTADSQLLILITTNNAGHYSIQCALNREFGLHERHYFVKYRQQFSSRLTRRAKSSHLPLNNRVLRTFCKEIN